MVMSLNDKTRSELHISCSSLWSKKCILPQVHWYTSVVWCDMFLYFSPICLESNWNPTSMKKAWENRSEQVYGHAEHAKVTDQNPADLGGFPSGCENGTGGSRPLQTQWLSPLQYLIPLLSGSWNHYRFSLQLIQRENITQISDLLLSLQFCMFCMVCNAIIWHGRVAEALPEHHLHGKKEFLCHTDLKEKGKHILGSVMAHLHSFLACPSDQENWKILKLCGLAP